MPKRPHCRWKPGLTQPSRSKSLRKCQTVGIVTLSTLPPLYANSPPNKCNVGQYQSGEREYSSNSYRELDVTISIIILQNPEKRDDSLQKQQHVGYCKHAAFGVSTIGNHKITRVEVLNGKGTCYPTQHRKISSKYYGNERSYHPTRFLPF